MEDFRSCSKSSRGASAHWTGCGDTSICVPAEQEVGVDLSKPWTGLCWVIHRANTPALCVHSTTGVLLVRVAWFLLAGGRQEHWFQDNRVVWVDPWIPNVLYIPAGVVHGEFLVTGFGFACQHDSCSWADLQSCWPCWSLRWWSRQWV